MLLDGRVVDNCTASAWAVYGIWKKRNRRLALKTRWPLSVLFALHRSCAYGSVDYEEQGRLCRALYPKM